MAELHLLAGGYTDKSLLLLSVALLLKEKYSCSTCPPFGDSTIGGARCCKFVLGGAHKTLAASPKRFRFLSAFLHWPFDDRYCVAFHDLHASSLKCTVCNFSS